MIRQETFFLFAGPFYCVCLLKRGRSARHQSSFVIQRVEQSTAVTVNGFTGTYVRMTAIMIRSNRIMHGRCRDNDAAKRGQIAVTQFQADDWHIPGN